MLSLLLCATLLSAEPNQVIVDAGRAIGVKSLVTGQWHPTLQTLAQEEADTQARLCLQGHHNFDRQFQQYQPSFPGLLSVVAESWPWQTMEQSGPEMWKCWRGSPGHWAIANRSCKYWGCAMSKGRDGKWYGAEYRADNGPVQLTPPQLGQLYPVEQLLLEETNRVRVAHGCRPLGTDLQLQADCRSHAAWMCSHGMKHGNLPHASAENIAWNQRTPKDVVNTWLHSAGHRRNMLNPSYTRLGAAGYESGNGPYWIQQFK